MKRKTKVVLIVISVFVLLCIPAVYYVINPFYFKSIKIESTTCDNLYNNIHSNISNGLVQVDNKLYYNYIGDPLKYGTYEISDGVTKRVYWEGFDINGGKTLDLDKFYNGKFLKPHFTDKSNFEVDFYNLSNQKFEHCFTVNNPNNAELNGGFFIAEGVQYYYTSDCETKTPTLYRYADNKLELVLSKELINLQNYNIEWYDNGYMYISTINNTPSDDANADCNYYICKYDIDNKKIVERVRIPVTVEEYYSDKFTGCVLIQNDKIYSRRILTNKDIIFVTDINNGTSKTVFESTDGSVIINGYGDTVYFGVEYGKNNGLYELNNKTLEIKHILKNTDVSKLYLVDDKWIYYNSDSRDLFRITTDGKTVEKVFG